MCIHEIEPAITYDNRIGEPVQEPTAGLNGTTTLQRISRIQTFESSGEAVGQTSKTTGQTTPKRRGAGAKIVC